MRGRRKIGYMSWKPRWLSQRTGVARKYPRSSGVPRHEKPVGYRNIFSSFFKR